MCIRDRARPSRTDKNGRLSHAGKKIWRSRYLYLLLLPPFVWYIVFMYAPLYGAQIAFRDLMPALGITGGKWVGFKYFIPVSYTHLERPHRLFR